MSFIIRYVHTEAGCVYERLLALTATPRSTGKDMVKLFEEVCEIWELDWKSDLIGQSYDGAQKRREPQSNGGGTNFENLPTRIGEGGRVFRFEDP